MRPTNPRRHARRALIAGAASLALLGPQPVAGADPGHRSAGRVRLAAEPGSVVRSAETGLARGVTRLSTDRYSMVGATWEGRAPRVSIRAGSDARWQRLPLLSDGPSAGSGEGRPGLGATDLVWTGAQSGITVRVAGSGFHDLELVLIDPGTLATDATARPTPAAQSAPRLAARIAPAKSAKRAPRPALYTRGDWDADPSWRNGRPRYTDHLKQVHVHHTATGNRYSRADVPGILRGMYRYHTHTLGWFDIGYNFLVDRFGRAWVGRSGGFWRLVRGAHTLGFNEHSVGIAVIGNFEHRWPGRRAVTKLVRLSAWKLDKHDRRAIGNVWVTSTGSDKYADGRKVRLPAIDGHRDTNDTACPGQRLYDRLPTIRRRAQRRINHFS